MLNGQRVSSVSDFVLPVTLANCQGVCLDGCGQCRCADGSYAPTFYNTFPRWIAGKIFLGTLMAFNQVFKFMCGGLMRNIRHRSKEGFECRKARSLEHNRPFFENMFDSNLYDANSGFKRSWITACDPLTGRARKGHECTRANVREYVQVPYATERSRIPYFNIGPPLGVINLSKDCWESCKRKQGKKLKTSRRT